MSLGTNLQFLRKMHSSMTQEELAERIGVSRQTVSKWEMDNAYPEMDKAIKLCDIFNCTLDNLLRDNLNSGSQSYINIRIDKVKGFSYVKYCVFSPEPEEDAIRHVTYWAKSKGIESPEIIGWDFPFLSQEQVNVFHMHGYCAACILPEEFNGDISEASNQADHKYAVITVKEPSHSPFELIPNAYKTLYRFIDVNGMKLVYSKEYLECFEKEYTKDGIDYMDIYICIEE